MRAASLQIKNTKSSAIQVSTCAMRSREVRSLEDHARRCPPPPRKDRAAQRSNLGSITGLKVSRDQQWLLLAGLGIEVHPD
jgi:hypothetical protein